MLQSQENEAIEEGISLQNLQCKKEIHVLVVRDNGKNACVKEKTAERMNWKIIN